MRSQRREKGYYRTPIAQDCLKALPELPGLIVESWYAACKDPRNPGGWGLLLAMVFAVPLAAVVVAAFGLVFSPFWALREWTPPIYNALADFFADEPF